MREILDSIIFKVVPMINVDGVVHGNTRAELTGVDPNRMWKRTMKRLCPSVSIIKKLIG
jgi:murein tripeptide amidase MpaA